jgi:cytochrome P450
MNTAAEPIAHHDPEPVVAHDGPSGCPVLHNFDILGEAEVNRPGTYTAVAREEAPVFFVPEVGQYVVTRWDDAHRALTDHKLFAPLQTPYTKVPAEAAELLPNGFAYGRASALSVLSPPAHTRVRKLAQKAFTRSAALAKAEEIRGICQELIDGFVADGSCDLVTSFTSKYPIRALCAILGIEHELAPTLYQWAVDIITLRGNPGLPHDEMMALCRRQAEMESWARELIADRRARPRGDGDVVSTLATATADDGTPRLTTDEIFDVIVIVITGGAETSSATTAQMVRRLLIDDALRARIEADHGLLEQALEEELRVDMVGRMTFRDVIEDGVELGGVPVPKGARLAIHLWSANHDPEIFSDPESFDLDRADVGKLLSWGKGTHFCLGAPLARVEIPIAIECLLERLPGLRLVPGHELQRLPAMFMPSVNGGLVVEWDA